MSGHLETQSNKEIQFNDTISPQIVFTLIVIRPKVRFNVWTFIDQKSFKIVPLIIG